jgi:hypothetical protein
VAKQAKRLLEAQGMKVRSPHHSSVRFFTSGDPSAMKTILPLLLGEAGVVESVVWKNDREVRLL